MFIIILIFFLFAFQIKEILIIIIFSITTNSV